MKKIINIVLIGTLAFTSCEKYLDVEPRSQVELDKLLEDEKGFQDALSGVYIQMREDDAYGSRMSQTTIEALVSSWDATSGSVEQKLGRFEYTDADVDKALSAIFSKQYSIIASANAILAHIDEKRSVFQTRGLFEMIKGEALAIRAYVHLDLLRLFGPIPTDPSQGSRLAYVTQFSKSIQAHMPFEQYKARLLQDVTEAATLLKDIDPIMDWSLIQLRNPNPNTGEGFRPENDFFAFRGLRMNYYAVRALEARAQLWFGNEEEAYQAAKEVVDAKNSDNTFKFRLGTASDLTAGDYVLREEHIFGLYDRKMYDWYQSRFTSGTLKKGSTVTTIRSTLFKNSDSDIRQSALWVLHTLNNASRAHSIRKYEVRDPAVVTISSDYKQIPMLRSSEMYLILAETAPFPEGLVYFKQFRSSRGLELPDPETAEALKKEIILEYRKEFYAEGQAFFVYKRNNVDKSAFIFVPNSAAINYVLPLPTVEPAQQ